MIVPVFIGWDERETVAYHVAAQSIIEKSSLPVAIGPVGNTVLPKEVWWRPRGEHDTTDFSNARFIIPYLCGYEGWSLFMDPDVLVREDIADLWKWRDDRYAVMCVHHSYEPTSSVKAMGKQTIYSKKNFSSVMLFNNAKCRSLTLEYVNEAHGLDLHQFKWIDESELGMIPRDWNHLVGEYSRNSEAKLVHYTLGGPYVDGYEQTEHADEWSDTFSRLKRADRRSSRVF